MNKTTQERKYLKIARKQMQRPYLFHAQDRDDAAMYLRLANDYAFQGEFMSARRVLGFAMQARSGAKNYGHKLP